MDPNIMKFLEEDEDETMHSGADVDAFTAELNRDIEGNTSTSQQPSDSDTAALSQGINQTTNQFPPQWQTSGHEGIVNFQGGQDLMSMEAKKQHSSQFDLQQRVSVSENRKEDNSSSNELNPLRHTLSIDACPQHQGDHNPFPVSLPMDAQTSGEQPLRIQESDDEPNPERDSQMQNLQNITNNQPMAMDSNDQQSLPMEFKDQQSLSTGNVNQTTSMGVSNEQIMSNINQNTTGMVMSSQQAMPSGMSNQQSVVSGSQQSGTTLKLNKQVPFGMLLPIIQPQLDKDRAMQLHTLYFKLKKNEISKDGFVKHMRSIVGDQMLKMAVYRLQTQAARNSQTAPNQFQSHSQSSARQMQVPSSAQSATDLINSTSDNNTAKSREMESQADSQVGQVSQGATSSSVALVQDRKHPVFPPQGLNKQQHMHFSQTSFPTYGSAGSSYSPFSATNATSSTPLRPQPLDSQMRQAPTQQNTTVTHLGTTPRAMNITNMPTFDRPHSLSDPKKIHGNLTHMNSNPAVKMGASSSMPHVKQEPADQSNEQQRAQLSSAHGLSSSSPALNKQGSVAPGNFKDDSFEMHSSRIGFTPSTSLGPTNSVSSSIPSAMETNSLSNPRISSLTSPIGPGNNSKAPPKKPFVVQKRPMETPGSSPPSR